MIWLCVARSSNLTVSRTIDIVFVFVCSLEEGIYSSLTIVFLAPRIKSTTSSSLQPITSTMSSFCCPTPTMRSSAFRSPCKSAGPPGTTRFTFVYSSSIVSSAPMPSRDKDIFIWKFSLVLGLK